MGTSLTLPKLGQARDLMAEVLALPKGQRDLIHQATAPSFPGARNILVGYISDGDTKACFTHSLATSQMADPYRRIIGVLNVQSRSRVVEGRNTMVKEFLDYEPAEWLLTIDTDMTWRYDDFDLLCRSASLEKYPILGGLCFGGGSLNDDGSVNIFPTLYRIWRNEETGELDSETVFDYPKDQVIQVSATGAAFMLIHRRVLTALGNANGKYPDGRQNPHPWYGESIVNGNPVGEDVTFCLRASTMGVPTHVHTGVKIGHEKRMILTEKMYEDSR